jgi:hypothetical protein
MNLTQHNGGINEHHSQTAIQTTTSIGINSINGILLYSCLIWLSCAHHAGAKGERRYSSYSFFTSAVDGAEQLASRPGRALPWEGLLVSTGKEDGWASELVWKQTLEEKFFASARD